MIQIILKKFGKSLTKTWCLNSLELYVDLNLGFLLHRELRKNQHIFYAAQIKKTLIDLKTNRIHLSFIIVKIRTFTFPIFSLKIQIKLSLYYGLKINLSKWKKDFESEIFIFLKNDAVLFPIFINFFYSNAVSDNIFPKIFYY